MTDPLTEAVARAEAQLEREVWIAVRVTSIGNVAFMGAFDTFENAKERCEYRRDPFIWLPRSSNPDVEEYETLWMPFVEDVDIKFSIALQHVQDHGEPTRTGTGEKI